MIYLRNSTRKHKIALGKIEKTARRLLAAIGEADASLSISFVGDAAIRRLNREHRGKDGATDVLSFPMYERKDLRRRRLEAGERLLGDIVISVDTAVRQGAAYDAMLAHEIERLLIHGVLHLIGHDHEQFAQRRRMEAEERRLAAAIGMRWPYKINP
jgi:probable rRNA maturation factor